MLAFGAWRGQVLKRAICWSNGKGAVVIYSSAFAKKEVISLKQPGTLVVNGIEFSLSHDDTLFVSGQRVADKSITSVIHHRSLVPEPSAPVEHESDSVLDGEVRAFVRDVSFYLSRPACAERPLGPGLILATSLYVSLFLTYVLW